MKKLNTMEMRNVEGGAVTAVKCICGKWCKRVTFLGIEIKSAHSVLKAHQKGCWSYRQCKVK